MRKPRHRSDQSLLHLVEQATELLRRVDTGAWVWWFGGTAPLICIALHFWTDMSRAADAWNRLPGAALLLALAYGWMKVAHAWFCDHLLRHLRGDQVPKPMPLRGHLRLISSQALIHSTTAWVLPLSLAALLPFGWAYAFYHNVTVLAVDHFRHGGRARDLIGGALRQTRYRQGSNHGLMIVLLVFGLMLWMNGWLGVLQISMLLKSFTGDENAITRNPWSFFSSTTIATTVLAAYLLGGPLVKAVYTLRCFYGQSRKNGEDLMVAFRATAANPAVLLIVIAGLLSTVPSQASAQQPAPAAPVEQASPDNLDSTALDQNIRQVLQQSDYQWRLPRGERPPEARGWLAGFMDGVKQWLGEMAKSIGSAIERWMKDLFKGWLDDPMKGGKGEVKGTPWADFSQMALKILLIVLGLVLAVLLVRQWLRSPPKPVQGAAALPAINLESDNVVATLLPENEWLKLAQEKIDTGDFRLAMRALFLATLAHLGERRLLGIGKSKSNGDYVRELARRARDRDALRQSFGDSVRVFDWAWYGLHDVNRETLDQFRDNHQRITTDGSTR